MSRSRTIGMIALVLGVIGLVRLTRGQIAEGVSCLAMGALAGVGWWYQRANERR